MKIKNVKIYGLEESIIRSGYPMQIEEPKTLEYTNDKIIYIGKAEEKDFNRARKLAKVPSGSGHDNFLKGIIVQFDIKYPQYWTLQFQRYTFPDIISSQSKMHRLITVKDVGEHYNKYVMRNMMTDRINWLIKVYNNGGFEKEKMVDNVIIKNKTDLYYTILSSLPLGYELWMGITLNYLSLKTIYNQRRNHKLKYDWGYFCNWIETLPMSELITNK